MENKRHLYLIVREGAGMSVVACFIELLTMITCNYDYCRVHQISLLQIRYNPADYRVCKIYGITVPVKKRVILVYLGIRLFNLEIIYFIYCRLEFCKIIRIPVRCMRGIEEHKWAERP